ncbi:MAG: tRNA1(Val) (adenine(37)-N6)-methyltransferase [Lachnospiraceae bacterium]
MKTISLKPGERVDDLQRNGYKIIQDPERFCFGMDAVLLSAFAKAKKGEKVLDLGTGNGVIPILMEAKTEGAHFSGLEIQEESADMARRSVSLNHLEDKIDIVTGDMKEAADIFGAASFHVITMNPPYMTNSHGLVNLRNAKAIARHEITCSLEEMISSVSKLLISNGRFYMVHRPFRLAEIMSLLVRYHLEPKRMRLVYPYVDKEPNMVLIEALHGGKPRITVEAPLIVYEKPGVYTEEVRQLYYKEQPGR